jgi:hypothetical protein
MEIKPHAPIRNTLDRLQISTLQIRASTVMTAAVPQAAISENDPTSVQRTGRLSTDHPKSWHNSTRDFVVTLFKIETLSGTTKVVFFVDGSTFVATKLEVENSSI